MQSFVAPVISITGTKAREFWCIGENVVYPRCKFTCVCVIFGLKVLFTPCSSLHKCVHKLLCGVYSRVGGCLRACEVLNLPLVLLLFTGLGVMVEDGILRWKKVGKENEGWYRCTARSSSGTQHGPWVYLKVLGELT